MASFASGAFADNAMPPDFTYLSSADSSITQEIRYAGIHNFVGRPVKGYLAPKCVLTKKAAEALAKVQTELKLFSLSLKVYDCYRPQKAVDNFVEWAKDLADTKMKKEFYPKVDKTKLFKDGYIARKSGHSRGSTIDITIIALEPFQQDSFAEGQKLQECFLPSEARFKDSSLDMGTGFDCFDPLAHTSNPAVLQQQKQNRLLLKSMMSKNGFKNLDVEWWHYTLIDEPYPDRYFDFDIK